MLVVSNVSLIRSGKTILDNINLRVGKSEVVALIGPTGAGKTSLLRLLDLLDFPSLGNIMINGEDAGNPPASRLQMRRHMAFVQQKPVAFNMNVFDNAALGLRWRHVANIEKEVNTALELVGLGGYQKQHARTLSGGEMQRLALARSIVTKPFVMYLDEPTANLDPVSTSKVEEALSRIIAETKLTVVMATHDMVQGQRLAGRIGVMMRGRLLQVSTPSEIFTMPESREIAGFVGVGNMWEGIITEQKEGVLAIMINGCNVQAVGDFAAGEKVDALIRPEEISLSLHREDSSARNCFKGTIKRLVWHGPLARIEVDCGFPVLALVTKLSAEEMKLSEGCEVYVNFKATSVKVVGAA